MATRLKEVDAVMVGMGWTGSILAWSAAKSGADSRNSSRPWKCPAGSCRHARDTPYMGVITRGRLGFTDWLSWKSSSSSFIS